MINGLKIILKWDKCTIKGPDGKSRIAWELFINNSSYGRDEIKERLLASYERETAPPASFHWRHSPQRIWARKKSRIQQPVEY